MAYTLFDLSKKYAAGELNEDELRPMFHDVEPVDVVRGDNGELSYVGSYFNSVRSILNAVSQGVMTFDQCKVFRNMYQDEVRPGTQKNTLVSLALSFISGDMSEETLWKEYMWIETPMYHKEPDGDRWYEGNTENSYYASNTDVWCEYGFEKSVEWGNEVTKMQNAFSGMTS